MRTNILNRKRERSTARDEYRPERGKEILTRKRVKIDSIDAWMEINEARIESLRCI